MNIRTPSLLAATLAVTCLATSSPGAVFHVDDYGAQPNNPAFNSANAFSQAIFAAKQDGPGAEVVFGPGRYYLSSFLDGQPFLTISNATGLTIRGTGRDEAWIINTKPKGGGFQFMQGSDIVLRDFSYDHDPLPFTQGVVTARSRNSNYVDVLVDAGFPVPTDPWYTDPNLMDANYTRWGMVFNPGTRRMEPDAPDFIFLTASPEDRGGGVYRFRTIDSTERNKISTIDVGDLFVTVIRPVIGGPVFFFQTEDAVLDNVDIYASASLGVTSFGATRTTIRNSSILRNHAEGRLVSTSGDGWHFQQDRVGPLIENTYLEGMADDGVAINCFPNPVARQDSPRELIVDSSTILQLGDEVTLFNPRDGAVLLETTITGLATAAALPGMTTSFAYDVTLAVDAPTLTILADRAQTDQLFNVSASGRDYIVRNNTIDHHRGRSIFVQAPQGLIEGNNLSRSGGFSIVVANEPFWPLGPLPGDTIMRNNTVTHGVENTFWFADTPLAAAIQVRGSRSNNLVANNRILPRIEISGNTIIDPPATALYVAASSDVVMYENTIISTGARAAPKQDEAIIIDRADAIVMVDNIIQDTPSSPLFRDGLRLTSTVQNGCGGFSLVNLDADLAPGRLDIRDERSVPGNYICDPAFFRFPVQFAAVDVPERGSASFVDDFELDVLFPSRVLLTNLSSDTMQLDNLELLGIAPVAGGFRLTLSGLLEGPASISVPAGAIIDNQGWTNTASRTYRLNITEDTRQPTYWMFKG